MVFISESSLFHGIHMCLNALYMLIKYYLTPSRKTKRRWLHLHPQDGGSIDLRNVSSTTSLHSVTTKKKSTRNFIAVKTLNLEKLRIIQMKIFIQEGCPRFKVEYMVKVFSLKPVLSTRCFPGKKLLRQSVQTCIIFSFGFEFHAWNTPKALTSCTSRNWKFLKYLKPWTVRRGPRGSFRQSSIYFVSSAVSI